MNFLPSQTALRAGSILITCLLTGCFELDQTMVLEPDGAVNCTLHYSMEEALLPHAREFQGLLENWQDVDHGSGLRWVFNEEAAKQYFSSQNITVQNYTQYSKAERRHVVVQCRAKNGADALKQRVFGDFQTTYDAKAETTTLRALLIVPPDEAGTKLATDALDKLREVTKGLRLRLELKTPTQIVQTTGKQLAQNRVEWIFDPAMDDTFLTTPPDISVTFKAQPPAAGNNNTTGNGTE